jgi:AmiR/NasT family two-component response regulator
MMKLQLGITIQEALAQLRATAYSEQRSIDEIAADVVARRRRFSKEDL